MLRFKSAYLKLTSFYVLIIMGISIGFSLSIYQISAQEIGQGLGRQSRALQDLQQDGIPFMKDLEDIRNQQIDQSNNNLKTNLYYYNLFILLFATIGSYFFARWTLRPIEEAYESQQRFTADASHELRTPLTAMKTEIEVALRDQKFNSSDSRVLLKSNLEEIAKLQQLSEALLKLAKADSEEKSKFAMIALDEVVTEAYEKVASLAEKKKIDIEAKLIKTEVRGDKPSLIELFVILTENAIKYSPSESKILIKMMKDDGHTLVSIKDHGLGIKASDLPHIFERFYRADHSRNKEKVDGYGLGLSIAKQIVDLHNGKISVKSTAGKGSEFIVRL